MEKFRQNWSHSSQINLDKQVLRGCGHYFTVHYYTTYMVNICILPGWQFFSQVRKAV